MGRSRGFVSFIIVGTGLMLVTLGLTFSYYVSRNSRLEREYIRDANYRKMVYIAMADLLQSAPAETMNISKVYPSALESGEVTLTQKAEFSSDRNFRVLSVVAEEGKNRFGLGTYTFIPTAAVQNRAGNYVFSSYTNPGTSTRTNMEGVDYSTGSYFNQPIHDKNYCAAVDMDDIKQVGFGQYIYYHRGDLKIPKAVYKCNSMVIVDGNLTVAAGTVFTGRMIFLVGRNGETSGGRTTIGNNVSMDDGLVLSEAALTIGSGCRLTGHFRSSSSIVINGKGTFTKRSDAGRPFQTVAFVF